MRIAYLGPPRPGFEWYLKLYGQVTRYTAGFEATGYDWVVSYGYRQILPSWIVRYYQGRAVNLHISYLPWNRGADPNLWSWIDDTPKGVTIHLIDEGVDTGPILAQRHVLMGDDETLATSYGKLTHAIERLFCDWWPHRGEIKAKQNIASKGSYHAIADAVEIWKRLPRGKGYDMPVKEIIEVAKKFNPKVDPR